MSILYFNIQIFRPNIDMVDTLNSKITKTLETSYGCGQRDEPTPIVLIFDDNDDSRAMLKILLEMWKYQVIEAKDGSEALAMAEDIRPDLILMDVKMPHLDGFVATEKNSAFGEI